MSMPESQPFRQPPPGANPRRGTMPIYYLDRERPRYFLGVWLLAVVIVLLLLAPYVALRVAFSIARGQELARAKWPKSS